MGPRCRSTTALTILALVLLSFWPPLPPAHGQTTTNDADVERRHERTTAARFGLEVWTSGIFDSNIDHDEADQGSYGATLAARARFRTRRFNLQYHASVDRYTRTVRWDRVTHALGAGIRQRITSRWRANALAELSAGQRSEDREPLSAQYMLAPELEYRFDVAHRFSIHGRYLARRSGASPVRPPHRKEETWQAGGEFRRNAGGRQSWAVRYRYEVSDTPAARNRYTRHAYGVNYRARVTPRDHLLLGLTFRPRRYPHRLLQPGSGEELRRDERWTYRVGWARALSDALRLEAAYTFDRQDSNDRGKNFRAHRVALTTGWFVR